MNTRQMKYYILFSMVPNDVFNLFFCDTTNIGTAWNCIDVHVAVMLLL